MTGGQRDKIWYDDLMKNVWFIIICGILIISPPYSNSEELEKLKDINLAVALKNLPFICKYTFKEKYSGKERKIALLQSSLTRYGYIQGNIAGMNKILEILSQDPLLIFTDDLKLNKNKCANYDHIGYPFYKFRGGKIIDLAYGRYPTERFAGSQISVNLIKPYEDRVFGSELSAWDKEDFKFRKGYLKSINNLHPVDKQNLKFLVNIISFNSDIEVPTYAPKKTKVKFEINYNKLKANYNKLNKNPTVKFIRDVNTTRSILKYLLILL